MSENVKPAVAEAVAPPSRPDVAEPSGADFGPGSKVNWDNPKLDPTKRKHVGVDPDGKQNARLLG